jgi:hypothetical protein
MPAPSDINATSSMTFPVGNDHPLAPHQSFRIPTLEDISSHPAYSALLNARVTAALNAYPPAERTEEVRMAVTNSIVAQIAEIIGHIAVLQLGNITVGAGQTLTYNGNWNEVHAADVRIASGGAIRVVGTDHSISATFALYCNSFGES